MNIHLFPPDDEYQLSNLLLEAWDASAEAYLLIRQDGTVIFGNDRTRSLFPSCENKVELKTRLSFLDRPGTGLDDSIPENKGRYQVVVSDRFAGKQRFEAETIPVKEGQWLVFRASSTAEGEEEQSERAPVVEQALELMQDERRRLSRFLHDTVSQDLVALSFSISRMQQKDQPTSTSGAVDQSLGLLDRCCRSIRLLSYILAPPLFDEIGIVPAFEWYGGQLQREAGIEVELAIDPLTLRPSKAVESILFSVLQACVGRSVRQMKKTKKRLSLSQSGDWLTLRYESALDPKQTTPGEKEELLKEFRLIVERLRLINGTLDVEQTKDAISVITSVPVTEAAVGTPS